MDDKRFEHIIQSKLKDYEADVPQDLWSKIENELPRKKTVWMKPVYRYAAACAALLIGGFTAFMFLYRPESSNHLAVNKEPISIALPEQQEIPASQQDNDGSTEEILWVDNTQAPISPKKQETRSTDKRSIDVQVRTTPEQENKVEAESHTVASPVENKEAQPLLAETPAANRPQSISQEEYERKLKEFESAGQQLQESDYEQILNSKNSDGHGFSIGLMASNSLPGNKNMENRPLTRSAMEINDELNLYSAEEPLKFMHKVPISFGITVEKKLPRNWGLESGVVYTLLRSDYKTASNNRKGKQELH